MVDVKKVFEALPNVNEIWLTDDGHFHLHSTHGGEKVTREDTYPITKEGEIAETVTEPVVEDVVEVNEPAESNEQESKQNATAKNKSGRR